MYNVSIDRARAKPAVEMRDDRERERTDFCLKFPRAARRSHRRVQLAQDYAQVVLRDDEGDV